MAATFWPYNYEPTGPRGQNSFNKERAHQHARLEGEDHQAFPISRHRLNQEHMEDLIQSRRPLTKKEWLKFQSETIQPTRAHSSQAMVTRNELAINRGRPG